MGHQTLIYGVISVPDWRLEDPFRLHRQNMEVLKGLNDTREWPWVTSTLFCETFQHPEITGYFGWLIPFGGTYKNAEWAWDKWLQKFEAVLRRLYWEEVHLHLRTEMTVGWHDYFYEARGTDFLRDPPSPVEAWEFSGGPRHFELQDS